MNIIFYIIIICVVVVVIVAFWIVSVIDRHCRNLDAIKKDTRALTEDLKAIAVHVEEINRVLDDVEMKMLERIDEIESVRKY